VNATPALTGPGIGPWRRAVWILTVFSMAGEAQQASDSRSEAAGECQRDAVEAHVVAQFARYGPLSRIREYFGFVFLLKGEVGSAVTRGGSCKNSCGVDTAMAAAKIPSGARPLGEWHTHPHESGAGTLSIEDVRGAYSNRRIRCYVAYYSQPNGDIYAWDPQQSSVANAMASRFHVGNYASDLRLGAVQSNPDD